jgi:hypothetical protein
MTNFNLSFPIDMVKKEERIVSGIATADNIDKVGDVVDFEASLTAFKNWQGNIREMHAPIAVGKAISYKPIRIKGVDGQEYNAIQVEAYISKGAETTWQKVLDGTLRAFSIGGKILKKEMMQNKVHNGRPVHVIKEYDLGELSLVDNPANAVAIIDLVKKADDGKLGYILESDDSEMEKAKQPIKDPKGGLTAAGRRYFKEKEGANLKPGVRGAADTPEKMRRKGSFLVRFFTNPSGPMKKPNGKPTRLALSAAAWGEPVPQDRSDAARLAAKGRRLLERYRNSKEKANKSITTENLKIKNDLIETLFEEIENIQIDNPEYADALLLDFLLDDVYDELGEEVAMDSDNLLQDDEKYDIMKPMDNTIDKETEKLSLVKKFISWLTDQPGDESLDKGEQAEASVEAEVKNDQMEEEMDIEVLKEALGSVIDQKLNDFATSLKAEVDANIAAKIDEVAKSFDAQKEEISQKLEATEKTLEEQTAKVEEFAQAGAVKKSVDPEEDEQVEELKKSEPEKSFWNNVYLPQGIISSLGYKS